MLWGDMMDIIKRIIMWIINFFRQLFGKKEKKSSKLKNNKNLTKQNKNKVNSSYINTTLPSYMLISDQDKLVLIKNIQNIKKRLDESYISEKEMTKIIALISSYGINTDGIEEYLNKQGLNKIDNQKIDVLLGDCDIRIKENIHQVISHHQSSNQSIVETIRNLDETEKYIKTHSISFMAEAIINDELINIERYSEIDPSTVLFDKDIFNTIKNWDKNILHEVKITYQKANYVTISTVMIDQIITKYQKIEEDYQHHRFNKYYYEKELGKIKEQIDFLKKIKNTKKVYAEIEKLKKELYTKSKDKYDILYNNEIFMSINKKCDELLDKVNQKVIDIKKEEKKEEKEDKKEQLKEDYLKRILLRFQDLNLSRDLILHHKEKENEIFDYSSLSLYIDSVYLEFITGIDDNFNYQRNKAKTELVKLYNDLNNIIAYKKKEERLSIDHINFKMEDLYDAVIIRKNEVEKEIDNPKKLSNSNLVDEKLLQIRERFIGNTNEKVLKKTN